MATKVLLEKSGYLSEVTPSSSCENFLYGPVISTRDTKEIVATLECDAPIMGDADTDILVRGRTSNNGIDWEYVTPAYTKIEQGDTYPVVETIKMETNGEFFCIEVGLWVEDMNGVVPIMVGATLGVTGVLRS